MATFDEGDVANVVGVPPVFPVATPPATGKLDDPKLTVVVAVAT